MKRTLLTFCLLAFFTLTSRAQDNTSLPRQYQKMMGKIFDKIPEVANPAVQLLDFAKSMIGTPYRYASSNPDKGFDCSGFVNYVFKNFGFSVPRSSPEFARAGVPVKLNEAKVGDVLIFTGSNPRVRKIGHVGIISSIEDGEIKFIHSTSGKAHGVTITDFDGYYKSRFIKAVSIIE
ncbi:C40 family peptidase [Pedobacter insulae]|uniref:NlpC/P60 family protein n=1 Tax=Pedobacter insulae TaxID=414048 RepID=A0A1I2VSP3_9SPHI|nr:C40 family peptidase [Pedobacter insulae]SFG91357.1 NlpC/P60 family protein [Pedobacter insulae]